MNKYIFNPFFIYIFIFTLVIALYQLHWTYIQAEINIQSIFFLIFTALVSILCMLIYIKIPKHTTSDISFSKKTEIGIWAFCLLGIVAEFVYQKQIPLLTVFLGKDYDYFNFGIPSFHALFLPYLSTIGVAYFYNMIKFKSKSYFLLSMLPIIFSLLIVNRGNLIFLLLIYMVIYLNFKKDISFKKLIYSFIGLLTALYLFGVVGNYRMVSSGYQADDIILTVGKATPEFYQSSIPKEYFWSYLYLVTPFSNFQHQTNNINDNTIDPLNALKYHVMIDWLQKRVLPNSAESNLLQEEFNVSTMYGDTTQDSGLLGSFIVFLWYVCVIFFCTYFCISYYRLAMVSVLCAITILQCFTNIMTVSGFGMIPFYLLLLPKLSFGKYRLL